MKDNHYYDSVKIKCVRGEKEQTDLEGFFGSFPPVDSH